MQLFASFSLSTRVVLLDGDNAPSVPRLRHRRPGAPRREQWEYIEASRRLRPVVLAHYGAACVQCGSRQQLELDHIHNDGKRHRQQLRQAHLTLDEWLIATGFPTNVVQILCHACHLRKTREAQRQQYLQRKQPS